MMRVLLLALFFGVTLMAGCATTPNSQVENTVVAVPKQFRDRQILVTLAGSRQQEWDTITKSLLQDYGLQASGNFPLKSLGIQCLVFLVPVNLELDAVIDKLRQDARVEHVQQNQSFRSLSQNYNDQYAPLQHGANDMHIFDAHKRSTGKGVKIAIIDTGFDLEHPDLQGRFSHTENFVEAGEKSFNADMHGTAVAGVIGARANNKIGVYGIAPDALMLGYKSCWYSSPAQGRALCSSWTLVKAIDKAILDQANIINLSLAGPNDILITRLLNKAVEQHILIIAAVDDSPSTDIGFPASLPNVIAVQTSVTDTSKLAHKFSTRSDIVFAPGNEILTTFPANRYDFISGSSLAAAHISGIAALALGIDSALSPSTLRELLIHEQAANGLTVIAEPNACLLLSEVSHTDICSLAP